MKIKFISDIHRNTRNIDELKRDYKIYIEKDEKVLKLVHLFKYYKIIYNMLFYQFRCLNLHQRLRLY